MVGAHRGALDRGKVGGKEALDPACFTPCTPIAHTLQSRNAVSIVRICVNSCGLVCICHCMLRGGCAVAPHHCRRHAATSASLLGYGMPSIKGLPHANAATLKTGSSRVHVGTIYVA